MMPRTYFKILYPPTPKKRVGARGDRQNKIDRMLITIYLDDEYLGSSLF